MSARAATARGVTVRTFHSLGMGIIGDAEGKRLALARTAENDRALFDLLTRIVAADKLCVHGKAPAAETLATVERLAAGLKQRTENPMPAVPGGSVRVLGYRIGRNYRPYGQGTCISTRPGKSSVKSICCGISDMTALRWTWQSPEAMMKSPSRAMTG